MDDDPLIELHGELLGRGFDPIVASAITANAGHESGGDPEAVSDDGTSIGLFQWHGPRADALMDYAEQNNKPVRAVSTQLDFLQHELQQQPQLLEAMGKSGSPAAAAELFQRQFERPKEIDPARSETANAIHDWYGRTRTTPPLGGTDVKATGTAEPSAGKGGIVAAIKEPWQTPLGPSEEDLAKVRPAGPLVEGAVEYGGKMFDAAGRVVSSAVNAGSELVAQAVEAAGYPTQASQLRRDLPGLATAAMVAATPMPAPRAAMKPTGMAQTVKTFEAEQVPPSLATTGSGMAGKTAVKLAETLPGGGSVIGKPLQRGLKATEAAERGAGRYGRAATPEAAGDALVSVIEGYKGRFSAEAERLYGEVGKHVDRSSPISLSGTTAAVNDIAGRFPSSPTLAEAATPNVVKQIRTALIETGGKLTWDEAQALRSRVGTMIREPQLAPDISRAQLNQLYGALTDDLAGAARPPDRRRRRRGRGRPTSTARDRPRSTITSSRSGARNRRRRRMARCCARRSRAAAPTSPNCGR
jgi:hypothetical protein